MKNLSIPKKLFISRKKASSRHIVNEKEVLKIISKYGYQSILLENYNAIQQANIFNRAKEIIAVHGSGLANIIFCKTNTKILEIDGFEGHKGPYSGISKMMSLHYSHLKTNASKLSQKEIERAYVFVDSEKLKSKLNQNQNEDYKTNKISKKKN